MTAAQSFSFKAGEELTAFLPASYRVTQVPQDWPHLSLIQAPTLTASLCEWNTAKEERSVGLLLVYGVAALADLSMVLPSTQNINS